MKKLIAMTMGLILTLSLTGCGSAAPSAETAKATEVPETHSVQNMINPYWTCQDAAEMQQKAGFEVSLPEHLPQWVSETIYRTIPEELIEVIYAGEDNEIRVRIARGTVDISGVYDSDASQEKDVTVGENTVHLKGEPAADGSLTVLVSTWTTAEGRTYSVTSTQGVAESSLTQLISQIR